MMRPGTKRLTVTAMAGLVALVVVFAQPARCGELILDEKEFLRAYRAAVEGQDTAQIEKTIARGEPVVFRAFRALIDQATRAYAGGEDGSGILDEAGQLADRFAEVTGNSGMTEMADLYQEYDQAQFEKRARMVDLFEQGMSLDSRGKTAEAFEAWTGALKILQELNDYSYVARIMYVFGIVNAAAGQYQHAVQAYDLALEVSRFTGDVVQELEVLQQSARLYDELGMQEQSLVQYQHVLELQLRLDERIGAVYTLQNIGFAHLWLEQYEQGVENLQKALDLALETGDKAAEASSRAGLATAFNYSGLSGKALAQYEKALPLFRELGNRSEEAYMLMNIGDVHAMAGRSGKALVSYKACMDIARELGDRVLELDVLVQTAHALNMLGRFTDCLNRSEQALELCEQLNDRFRRAEVLTIMGSALARLGRMQEALDREEQAIVIQKETMDIPGQVGSLISAGTHLEFLGRVQAALGYYRQAVELALYTGDPADKAQALSSLAGAYLGSGRYTDALDTYREAMELADEIRLPASRKVVLPPIVLGMGVLQERLGRYEQVLEFLDEFEQEVRTLGIPSTEIDMHLHRGRVLARMERYEEAAGYLVRALEKAEEQNMPAVLSAVLGELGLVYRKTGDLDRAEEHLRRALEVDKRIGNQFGLAAVQTDLGGVALDRGEYSRAAGLFEEAARLSEELGLLERVWRSRRGLGKALWESGRPEEAAPHYRAAVETIAELYRATSGFQEEERTSMIQDKGEVLDEFIELLLLLHRKEPDQGHDREAFMITEQDKSRIFQEMMARSGARVSLSGDEDFVRMVERSRGFAAERANLRGRLNEQLSLSSKQRNPEVVESLKRELGQVEREQRALDERMQNRYPRYTDLLQPRPLEVSDLQMMLEPGETLVCYHVGRERSAAFVVTADRFETVQLPARREEIASLVGDLRKGLESVSTYRDLERFRPGDAWRLYRAVFQPLEGMLAGTGTVYVSADDVLHTFPLEALVFEEPDEQAIRKARREGRRGRAAYLSEYEAVSWLVEKHRVCYLPSASVLRSMREHRKPGFGEWDRPLIAFADPVFSAGDDSVEGGVRGAGEAAALMAEMLQRSTGGVSLARLPESAEEARTIREVLDGNSDDLYLRDHASEGNVFEAPLGSARFLLFSTHGLLGGEFTGVAEPSLALTLVGDQAGRDGFLAMSEVLALDLNADLVVLSACNTSGRGEQAGRGEGFAGLTRAFMYAGGRSLLVTHWSVESMAARDLMVNMFEQMKEQQVGGQVSKAGALRGAKLRLKEAARAMEGSGGRKLSLAHPFFWAPFVLVGDAGQAAPR